MLDLKKLLTKVCSALGFFKASSSSTTYGTLYVHRTFNVVTVIFDGVSNALTHSSYTKLFTLSANERPSGTIRFVAYDNDTSNVSLTPLIGYINSSGECYIWVYGNSGATVAPRFHITYTKTGSLT